MKLRSVIFLVLGGICILAGLLAWHVWQQGEARRVAIKTLRQFQAALDSHSETLLNIVVIPTAIQTRTAAEQMEFLTKVLRDEISEDGLAVLKKEGTFGPLKELFPKEAATWASQTGVKIEDCVAFQLEKNGIRAEIVLTRPATIDLSITRTPFRIVRCNNIRPLASPNRQTVNSRL